MHLHDRLINHLKICFKYRKDFEGLYESFEFQRRHIRLYFIAGYPYFYQLGTYKNYRIKHTKC